MKNCSIGKRLVIQRGTDGEILVVAFLQLLSEPFFDCCFLNEIQTILTSAVKGHHSLTNSKYTIFSLFDHETAVHSFVKIRSSKSVLRLYDRHKVIESTKRQILLREDTETPSIISEN